MPPTVLRSGDRASSATDWLTSRHGFSFGDHYDPVNTHHGVLLVHNEDVVLPGQGYDTHPHRETEIVTWVLSGSLVHKDSEGRTGVVFPGLAQRMSAGTGVLHSERNDLPETGGAAAHFVQMWVLPDETGRDPGYEQLDISGELTPGRLVTVASGDRAHDSAIRIANANATLHAARLGPGQHVTVPPARFTHLFVTGGAVTVEGEALAAGDSLRATGFGGSAVTAIGAAGDADTEVLIWSMNARLGE